MTCLHKHTPSFICGSCNNEICSGCEIEHVCTKKILKTFRVYQEHIEYFNVDVEAETEEAAKEAALLLDLKQWDREPKENDIWNIYEASENEA